MNRKLKVLSIVLIALYLYSIFDNVVQVIPQMISYYSHKHQEEAHGEKGFPFPSPLKAESNKNATTEKKVNNRTGKEVFVEKDISTVYFPLSESDNLSVWPKVVSVSVVILSLMNIIVLIYIPILFFKTLSSIGKNKIFTRENMIRIRRLGYCVIFIGLVESFSKISDRFIFSQLISFDGYTVSYYGSLDYFGLIFGVTLLAISEALRQALKMKEEQDLTI
ncbi:hypothetical protein M2132_001731 [Dysgonomonas sp. PH5-45]|uniref:DUF2975 domain-containing protein n=1 Tax=unclassified Dysgonomonas TaxID=2630389 RepID=UPI0024744DC3|nr:MULTISPECIES: DUF2975 domain-containing protein [unclassified Dysgonomonas]MDH6355389.1 hypothetical protein [Dysgonomonas sp. PH5-45]MDH6388287.1 hypothetical protein [Dysgonomonas sp. PH5-37]